MASAAPHRQEADEAIARAAALLPTEPDAAHAVAMKVLQRFPQDAGALRLLAKAMAAQGRPQEAAIARARAVQASRHDPRIVSAHQAVVAGELTKALEMLAPQIRAHPDDPVARLIEGQALLHSGRMAEALAAFEAALAFMPEYREARLGLARAHYQRFDPQAALAALEPLAGPDSKDLPLLHWKATMLAEAGEQRQALGLYLRLLEGSPADAALLMSAADLHRGLGETDAAEALYRRAMAAAPGRGAPWWSIASLGGTRLKSEEQPALEAALARAADPDDRTYLGFALATLLDRQGEYERAFALFVKANSVRRATLRYDAAAFAARQQAIAASLGEAFFRERSDWGEPSGAPIFIVGMPRAGSTLAEQLLAGHPQVRACGELPIVTSLLRETAGAHALDAERDIVELLRRLDAPDCARLGAEYLRRARSIGAGNARFTDKLPHNWAELAFIRLILPNAQVVDIRRNALDCCVSNFVMLFQPGHPASYDLREMAEYYATYAAFMDWADAAMPGAVYRLRYERLVEDTEGEMRALCAFLGLPFDPACLHTGGSDRVIATASAEQARQPVDRRGIGTWQRFEPWLGALRDRLAGMD